MATQGSQTVDVALSDEFEVILTKQEYRGGEEHSRDREIVFMYRLCFGNGWVMFPVTMAEPADCATEELRVSSVRKLHFMLAQLAEAARIKGGSPRLNFVESM